MFEQKPKPVEPSRTAHLFCTTVKVYPLFMQLCPRALEQGRAGWVWRCLLMPHLKAGNREASSVVRWSNNRNKVGAVRDVLVVELHRNLVITCRRGGEDVTQSRRDASVIVISVCVCVCVCVCCLYRAPERCTRRRRIRLCGHRRRSRPCWVLPRRWPDRRRRPPSSRY